MVHDEVRGRATLLPEFQHLSCSRLCLVLIVCFWCFLFQEPSILFLLCQPVAKRPLAKIFKFPRSGNFPTGKKKREKREKEKKEEEGAKKSKASNCHSAHADASTYINANINYFYETYCRIGRPGAWATCHQAHCERLPLVQVL